MSKQALGIIETLGLAAAIEAADAALKSAQVELIGYELAKGSGMTTVKVMGNVGAVKAAIEAARIAASKVNTICGYRVIARMSEGLDIMVYNEETVGYREINEPEVFEDVELEEVLDKKDNPEEVLDEKDNPMEEEDSKAELCNLCWDPKCPRQKGDLRINCIHYNDEKKEEK